MKIRMNGNRIILSAMALAMGILALDPTRTSANAESADVVAGWTEHRSMLTVAVINPTDEEPALTLQIRGVDLAGRGVLHRMTPTGPDDRDVVIDEQALDGVSVHSVLPLFSVNIYQFSNHDHKEG